MNFLFFFALSQREREREEKGNINKSNVKRKTNCLVKIFFRFVCNYEKRNVMSSNWKRDREREREEKKMIDETSNVHTFPFLTFDNSLSCFT